MEDSSHEREKEDLRARALALVSRYAPPGVATLHKAGVDALGPRALLVDCRTADERAVSTIPGAVSRDEFERGGGPAAALREGRCVVPYCTVGLRSGNYALDLQRRHGGLEVRNSEGILLWSIDGGGLECGGAPTSRLHAFGPEFAVVRRGVEPVLFGGGGLLGMLAVAREAAGRRLSSCFSSSHGRESRSADGRGA